MNHRHTAIHTGASDMTKEYTTNSIWDLEIEKRRIEKEIKEYKGIVPADLYDRLFEIEMKLQRMGA